MNGKFFYGWIIALCCTIVTIINGGIFFTFGVFFKPVALDFAWSRGEFAGNYAAMLLAYAPGAFFAGRLANRHGPRVILLISALLIGLGFIGCSNASNLVFMIFSYATIGFGLGATLALPTATIQHWFVKWRGTMIGIVTAGMGIGGLFFAPFANYLITVYGWRTAYLTIGLIFSGAIAIAASFLVAEPGMKKLSPLGYTEPEPAQHLESDSSHPLSLTQAFKLASFRSMTALYILSFMPAFFVMSHLVPYVTDQGISASAAAQGLGMMAGVNVIGRLVMSWIAGKIGWMRSLTICYFFATVAIIWLIFVNTPWEFYVFVIIYGLSWGSAISLLGGAVGFLFGLPALSELLGFLMGISVLTGAVIPWLGGLSFDLTNSYLIAISVAAAIFSASGVLSWVLMTRAK